MSKSIDKLITRFSFSNYLYPLLWSAILEISFDKPFCIFLMQKFLSYLTGPDLASKIWRNPPFIPPTPLGMRLSAIFAWNIAKKCSIKVLDRWHGHWVCCVCHERQIMSQSIIWLIYQKNGVSDQFIEKQERTAQHCCELIWIALRARAFGCGGRRCRVRNRRLRH